MSTANARQDRWNVSDSYLEYVARQFDDLEGFIDIYSSAIELLTGPYAVRTRARYALFLEAASDPDLFAPLHARREGMAAWSRSLLVALGATASAFGQALHRVPILRWEDRLLKPQGLEFC
mgnify:CR=1 FL=1